MAKKIYIDPGHSNVDPGAVSHAVERDLNEKVSKFMNEYLLTNYVCETKVCPVTVDALSTIAADANAWGADLFVSVHFNAGGGDGFEALVYSQERVGLGQIFAKYIAEAGQNLRPYGAAPGVKIRNNLYVLKNTNMPAVLNEGAFVDNLKDIQDWNEDAELKKMGEAYAKAAAEYLNLPRKVVTKPESVVIPEPVIKPAEKVDEFKSYKVRVTASALNVRKGPGTNYGVTTVIRDKGVYTIVGESNGWGKLKSGAGWISLNYTKKI